MKSQDTFEMSEAEHTYFHSLMWILEKNIEPKFSKGCVEHRDEGMLWDMSDEELSLNIRQELFDLNMYLAEQLRREQK